MGSCPRVSFWEIFSINYEAVILFPFLRPCAEVLVQDIYWSDWTYDTFEYNFEINHRFTKYLKEIYRLGSDKHYSFKYFTKSALVTKI